MKKLLVALCLMIAVPAQADTQAVVRTKLGNILKRDIQGADLLFVLKHMALAKIYATAAERDATTPDVGSIGYAIDDGSFKWYSSGGWQAVTLTAGGNATVTGVTYSNGGVDRSSAAALAIGATNATQTAIGATATPVVITAAGAVAVPSTTTLTGALFANGGIDRSTGAALAIGATNATQVNITPPVTMRKLYQTKSDNYPVVYATDCGSLITESVAAKTITLPLITAASAGCTISVVFTMATGNNVGTIAPNASDGIAGSCGAVVLDGVASKTLINTGATHKLGDHASLTSTGVSGAGGWLLTGCNGVWAEGS